MSRIYILAVLTAFMLESFFSNPSQAQTASPPRLVFAHYMVTNRDYGGGVEGYIKEMREAQAAGIDGFVLNVAAWNGANYRKDTAAIFQAAHVLGNGFKLFFSADMCCSLSSAEIIDMMNNYASDNSYWRYQGRPVLSAWSGGTVSDGTASFWKDKVLTPLRQSGINPYFVPMLYAYDISNNQPIETPGYTNILINYEHWWKDVVDGAYYFGGLGVLNNPINERVKQSTLSVNMSNNIVQNAAITPLNASESYAKVMHDNGKTFMSSVMPQYWGNIQLQNGRRYYEFEGGKGIDTQWRSIINTQKPEWVELFTWNDFDEATYWSPIDDVSKYWPYVVGHRNLNHYKSHAGALALNSYYIDWYKNYPANTPPPPPGGKDNIYVFYRTSPLSAVASSDKYGPVTWRTGNVKDNIFITTILIDAATLVVNSGDSNFTVYLPAGLSNTQVPFKSGVQSFVLYRNGSKVLTMGGEDIEANPVEYNFNYYTNFASGAGLDPRRAKVKKIH